MSGHTQTHKKTSVFCRYKWKRKRAADHRAASQSAYWLVTVLLRWPLNLSEVNTVHTKVRNKETFLSPVRFPNLPDKNSIKFRIWGLLFNDCNSVECRSQWTSRLRHERWDRGFESHSRHGCLYYVRLFCVCILLCVGSSLATNWSPVQGVLPAVYRIKKLKKRPRPNKGLYCNNNNNNNNNNNSVEWVNDMI
jgi:hypothetical protein